MMAILDVPADSTGKDIIYAGQEQCRGIGMVHNCAANMHVMIFTAIAG